jgi:hypothetical protein
MNAIVIPADLEFDPLEIDPRPCELCGLTIDRHETADHGEGPEHYCPEPDDLTLDELERRAELVRQIEVAAIVRRMELNDPRDAWRHTGEAPALIVDPQPAPRRYRTPQATVDAFWHVVRLADPGRLAAWLDDHPKDEVFLLNFLEKK